MPAARAGFINLIQIVVFASRAATNGFTTSARILSAC
jgi:hypothetical protein